MSQEPVAWDAFEVPPQRPTDHPITLQRRLLATTLNLTWRGFPPGTSWQVFTSVGFFPSPVHTVGAAPDVMLSLQVPIGHANDPAFDYYFQWVRGKPPELVIDIRSDNVDAIELDQRQKVYARGPVEHRLIWDLYEGRIESYRWENSVSEYIPMDSLFFPKLGLGLTTWHGKTEGCEGLWLRWHDSTGALLPTLREYRDKRGETLP